MSAAEMYEAACEYSSVRRNAFLVREILLERRCGGKAIDSVVEEGTFCLRRKTNAH